MTDAEHTWSVYWSEVISSHHGKVDSETTLHPPDSVSAAGIDEASGEFDLDETATWRYRSSQTGRWSFRPLAVLGRGGMGEVVLAEQGRLDREVAVKVLPEDQLSIGRLAALREEARLGARLEHPNVVPVHDAGADYMVMRRVAGRTLQDVIEAGADLPALVDMLRKVCEALAFAHDRGVIHRDLKPSNIMVGSFGEVLVTDWGLALRLSPLPGGGWGPPAIESAQAAAGTLAYLAPEMARAHVEDIGPATDCYLLGAVLYRILAGRPPHLSRDAHAALASAADNAYPPLTAAPHRPQRLIDLQQRAMHSDPLQRPSMLAIRDGLSGWLHSVDAEQSALAAADRGRQAIGEATAAGDPAARYAAYAAAIGAFELALDHWEACPQARDGLRSARRGYIQAAIANQDLVLARCLADGDEHFERIVGQAEYDRLERRRHARRIRTATALLVIGIAGGLSALLIDGLRSQERARLARTEEARALVREAKSYAGQERERAHVDRLQLAFRAAGLQGDDPTVAEELRAAIADFGAWAIDHQRWELAATQAQQAAWLGADAVANDILAAIDHAQEALAAERAAILDRRRERLAQIVGIVGDDLRGGDWQRRRAAEIAGWDGTELADELRALASHEDALIRVLIADVLGRRSDFAGVDVLVALTDDPRRMVVDEAWSSLAQVAGAEVIAQLRERLLDHPDPLRARELSAGFGPRLLPDWSRPPADDAERRHRVRIALIAHQPAVAADLLAGLEAPTPADLEQWGRLAGWVLRDAEACRTVATRLAELDSDQPWAAALHLRADQLAGSPVVPPGDGAAAPLRWLAAHLDGRETAATVAVAEIAGASPPVPFADLAVQALEYHQHRDPAAEIRVSILRDLHWILRRISGERRAGRDRIAHRLVDLLAEQRPWDVDALILGGEAALALGRDEAALAALEEAVLLRPDRGDAWATLAEIARETGDGERALAAWQRSRTAPYPVPPLTMPAWILLLTEAVADGGGARDPDDALAGLMAEPATLARFLPLVVRRLVEADRHHDALYALLTASERGAGIHFREAFDILCLSTASLRESGWPGMRGRRLAAALVREALVAAEAGRPDDCDRLLAQARAHASEWSLARRLAGFGAHAQGADRAGFRRLVAGALDDAGLVAHPRLRHRLQRWQEGLTAGADGPRALRLDEIEPRHPPLRPLPDCRLHPDDQQRWAEWWVEHVPRLPHPDDLGVGVDLDAPPAPQPPRRAERGRWPAARTAEEAEL